MRIDVLLLALLSAFLFCGCEQTTVQGPGGQDLTVVVPDSLTLHRGQTSTLEVSVWRKNFTGPVTVSIAQLPKGVTVPEYSQTMETDKVAFILGATDNADLVGHQQVKITAKGPGSVQTTQYVSLSVVK